jgi:hypothetical protein
MASRLLAVCSLLLAATFASAEPLDLTNARNEEAATTLIARFFENIGLDVFGKREKQFGLRFGGYNIGVIPVISLDNGTRLNAYITYDGGSPANLKNEKLLAVINEINRRFNYVSAYVDNDGDINFRFVLVFDKKLEPKIVHRWLKHIEIQSDAILEEFKDQLKPFLASKTEK